MPFLITILFLILSGCLQTENSSKDDDALANISPDFVVVQEALSSKCSSCHNFHTLSEALLVSTGRVVPGDADNSPIYNRCIGSLSPVGNKNMPTSGAPLSPEELEAMVDWINALTP